jgi:hypothetical protein
VLSGRRRSEWEEKREDRNKRRDREFGGKVKGMRRVERGVKK